MRYVSLHLSDVLFRYRLRITFCYYNLSIPDASSSCKYIPFIFSGCRKDILPLCTYNSIAHREGSLYHMSHPCTPDVSGFIAKTFTISPYQSNHQLKDIYARISCEVCTGIYTCLVLGRRFLRSWAAFMFVDMPQSASWMNFYGQISRQRSLDNECLCKKPRYVLKCQRI